MAIQNRLVQNLQFIAKLPKGEIRQHLRQRINTDWHALPVKDQHQTLPTILQEAKKGGLSPNNIADYYARQGQFPSGAGPAIHWLSRMLDSTSPKTLQQLYARLTPEEKELAETIRLRKPVRGVIDPLASSSLPAYLKNNPAIGSLPPGKPIKIAAIGKGASNIITLYHLNKASDRFQGTFFEYPDREGGRMYSRTFSSGGFSEEGAMRSFKNTNSWQIRYFNPLKPPVSTMIDKA